MLPIFLNRQVLSAENIRHSIRKWNSVSGGGKVGLPTQVDGPVHGEHGQPGVPGHPPDMGGQN